MGSTPHPSTSGSCVQAVPGTSVPAGLWALRIDVAGRTVRLIPPEGGDITLRLATVAGARLRLAPDTACESRAGRTAGSPLRMAQNHHAPPPGRRSRPLPQRRDRTNELALACRMADDAADAERTTGRRELTVTPAKPANVDTRASPSAESMPAPD